MVNNYTSLMCCLRTNLHSARWLFSAFTCKFLDKRAEKWRIEGNYYIFCKMYGYALIAFGYFDYITKKLYMSKSFECSSNFLYTIWMQNSRVQLTKELRIKILQEIVFFARKHIAKNRLEKFFNVATLFSTFFRREYLYMVTLLSLNYSSFNIMM